MKKAIDADKAEYFKFTGKRDEGTQPNPHTVLVRFMDDPDRKPAEINGMSSSTVLATRLMNITLVQRKYSGYAEIRWELINESLVERVDLWIRHKNDQEQASTPNWHYWEYANPKCPIIDDKETLEIDVVDIQKRVEYIVAAVREEPDREIPVPLGESLRDAGFQSTNVFGRHRKRRRELLSKGMRDTSLPPQKLMAISHRNRGNPTQ
jgi:hypothetical protein